MSIPPISTSGGPLQSPSDNPIVDELENDLQTYKEYMGKYEDGDHSPETLKNLQNAAKNLVQFIKEHKKEIERVCKAKGWPATGTGGYDECIQGAKRCEKDISKEISKGGDISIVPLNMLNEDVSGIISMMTQPR